MRAHYQKILADSDNRVAHSLNIQVKTPGRFYGGFTDQDHLVQAKYAIYRVTGAVAAYCNEESRWYGSQKVFAMIQEGIKFIAGKQHETGLFDFIPCNFASAPDTAFCVKRLLPTVKYLQQNRQGAEQEELYEGLYQITKKAAQGLMIGGFHTPNHRWAIASNLVECGAFLADEEMKKCARQYLLEGIDCNEDGEYAERSAGNYNRINNDAMITLGDYLGEEIYYQYAIRNLRMMLTYLEPDGSIFTANSTRQDNGKRIFPKDYYMEYLDLGFRKDIPEFLDVANYLFMLIEKEGLSAPDCLMFMMNRPELKALEHEGMFSVPAYQKWYRDSGIIRTSKKHYTYTLMSGKSGFLYFANETMRLQMKIGGSFCEHRAFKPQDIREIPGGYQLTQTMAGWYYLPFEEKPAVSDWWQMDHSQRKKMAGPNLHLLVDVLEAEDGVDVKLKLTGVTDAPFRVELEVMGAELVWNSQFASVPEPGKSMVLKAGTLCLGNDRDSLEVGPGFGEHLYIAGLFGSEARSEHAYTIYLTDYTEMEHTVKIRSGKKAKNATLES